MLQQSYSDALPKSVWIAISQIGMSIMELRGQVTLTPNYPLHCFEEMIWKYICILYHLHQQKCLKLSFIAEGRLSCQYTWGPPGSCWPQVGPMLATYQALNFLKHANVWCHYVSFLQNHHKRHTIAHLWGWSMGCLLWVSTLIYILLQSLFPCKHTLKCQKWTDSIPILSFYGISTCLFFLL